MPVYRCNQCGHVSESGVAGTQVACSVCQTPCSVFDTVFYVKKLIERYSAAIREVKALQADERQSPEGDQDAPPQTTQDEQQDSDNENYATAAQHAPIEKWLKTKQIEARFDHSTVDTSGYFDEAAQQLGKNHALFGELGAAQASDQFLRFAGEHAAADHFYPAFAWTVRSGVLQEHLGWPAGVLASGLVCRVLRK